MPSPSTQRLAVILAFVSAGLSFAAVAITYSANGTIRGLPLFGGLLMLALGISGLRRLKRQD
jgi:hypothetical protein